MGLTTTLAEDLFRIQTLTAGDRAQLRLLITDFFAAACAGYRINRRFNEAVEQSLLPQGGAAESRLLFREGAAPARIAAFLNAVYGHGAELDDGNKRAAGHAGVHLIPAVFALADKLGSSGEDVLLALATGYEAYIRISSAAQPGMVQRGYHSTGAAGTLACAAACARLYRLDAQGIEDAIALATTMTGGLLSYGDSRPEIKPLNPAKAAENGLFAAMLAAAGVQGPTEALEGKNGWFHAVTEQYDPEMLKGGSRLLLHDCYLKLYPSCRHTHCGIDAAIALHARLDPDKVEHVRVYIYPNAIKLAGLRIPKTPDETKFSVQYTLARALRNGSYGIADMDLRCLTPDVLALIEKTELIPDDTMEDRAKGIRGTRVEVETSDRGVLRETVLTPKGDPERPLSAADVREKLRVCAGDLISRETQDRLAAAISRIGGGRRFENPMKETAVKQL